MYKACFNIFSLAPYFAAYEPSGLGWDSGWPGYVLTKAYAHQRVHQAGLTLKPSALVDIDGPLHKGSVGATTVDPVQGVTWGLLLECNSSFKAAVYAYLTQEGSVEILPKFAEQEV